MFNPGDTIEYLADVSSPLNQKGIRGQTKIIDRDIPMWTARFLFRGGKVRLYDPASPLQLEEEKPKETKKGPDGPAEVSGPASTKVKPERRTTNGQRKRTGEQPGPKGTGESHGETDQSRDHGIKSTKRKTSDRGA